MLALALALALTCLTGMSLLWAQTEPRASTQRSDSGLSWKTVSVTLPASASRFAGGDGAALANSQCLICHSAGMVLTQPKLSAEQWRAEIEKMRTAYGAPLPADQIDRLTAYLRDLKPQ